MIEMTRINKITIQKEIDGKKCSIDISSPTNLDVSISTERITATDIYGRIISETKLHWRDMFADGVQLLIEGIFEDTDSGIATTGIYDMLNNTFTDTGD